MYEYFHVTHKIDRHENNRWERRLHAFLPSPATQIATYAATHAATHAAIHATTHAATHI